MSTSPNLLIAHISSSQASKEITCNSGFDSLDGAIAGQFTKALSDANYTLADPSEARVNLVFVFTGALTAGRNIIVPTSAKLYIVKNSTTGGFALTVKTASGTGIAVSAGDGYVILYADGTNVVKGAATGPAPFDVAVTAPGVGTNAQLLLRVKLARAVTFPASATLSQASASANATASTTYTFKKNGSSFATVNYALGASVGTWTQASDSVFAAGDLLELDGPATADATLANVGITLAGVRS
jgi:hypothetical protein